ncbi:DUF4209 domain-containing protein [Okeania sp. SIO2B3]|uniref:DUF4209 domain-containing protein n=1 Tax=Okeania sp. SIO2B3 TaxID=2607784 RepID=UPI0013C18040|nr:DUF4209 domain-containing protein [Okeania sp. SIO2B3]NET43525.1 DUF4209 domain-containing protein [Okeania sp. SIO2B3]
MLYITKKDFIKSGWQDVVNASEKKECFAYIKGFCQKAQEAEEVGNIREQTIFKILAKITLVDIRRTHRQLNEEDFAKINLTDEHLNFLVEIAPEISDSELQARVANILWSKQRNYSMAKLAINAYIKSAIELEDFTAIKLGIPTKWIGCYDRIERAFQLAKKINYQVEKVVEHIEKVLERYQGEDPLWLSAKLMELLQKNKLGCPKKYAALAKKAALLSESSYDWDRARNYWEIKAKWHQIQKDKKNERAALMLAAETYFKQVEKALKNNQFFYLAASNNLQKAIEAFRNIPGTKEETIVAKARAEEAHKLLLQYQEKSRKKWITNYSDPVDFTEAVEKARAIVRGEKLEDALFSLALSTNFTEVSQLKKQIEQIVYDFPVFPIIKKEKINQTSKVVARQKVEATQFEELKAAMEFEMYHTSASYQSIQAQVLIDPAREQINLEHSVELKDFFPIVSNNPFVPPKRKYLFAKGLYAGLTGDFYTSTHILIPQIENAIRYLLWKQSALPSSYEDKGIQNEYNLNKILYLPEMADIFDEDTLFDLRGLLVEHSGSNLRNRMTHGLLDDEDFLSPLMSYLWWVTLRLCCLPNVIYQHERRQKAEGKRQKEQMDGVSDDFGR